MALTAHPHSAQLRDMARMGLADPWKRLCPTPLSSDDKHSNMESYNRALQVHIARAGASYKYLCREYASSHPASETSNPRRRD